MTQAPTRAANQQFEGGRGFQPSHDARLKGSRSSSEPLSAMLQIEATHAATDGVFVDRGCVIVLARSTSCDHGWSASLSGERPVPIGSLIKPFTALAYADTHRFTYPTCACRGSR